MTPCTPVSVGASSTRWRPSNETGPPSHVTLNTFSWRLLVNTINRNTLIDWLEDLREYQENDLRYGLNKPRRAECLRSEIEELTKTIRALVEGEPVEIGP